MKKTELSAPSVYGSFNARFLTVDALADGFIPSDDFDTVSKPAHTVILGPRGSGKTCLLKMLQPAALAAWKGDEGAQYREAVKFIGVYIPTDVSWREQSKNLGSSFDDQSHSEILERAALTYHVLYALVGTLLDCVENKGAREFAKLQISFDTERELVGAMAKRWKLEPAAPTLQSLKNSLGAKSMDVWVYARQEILLGPSGRSARFAAKTEMAFDFLHEILWAIEITNDAAKVRDQRWALLFDELEIAPDWLLDALIRSLRSIDQRVLLKLSLSPFYAVRSFDNVLAPRPGHDFDLIRLWYGYKKDARSFCERMFRSLLEKNKITDKDLYKILGYSPLKGGKPNSAGAYSVGSSHHKLLMEAYNKDASFHAYCEDNKVDLNKIGELTESTRASLIRKIIPTLIVRTAYRSYPHLMPKGGKRTFRSRKKADIYGGVDTFFELIEGNPRWLIGITNELIPEIRKHGRVPVGTQFDRITEAAIRFLAILNTHPLCDGFSKGEKSLADALGEIAKKIHDSVVTGDFKSEPYGGFIVDKNTSPKIFSALGAAINAGAIISTSDDISEPFVYKHLIGKSFRMTYLLSPFYGIPVRIGRSFPLSSLFPEIKDVSTPLHTHPKPSPPRRVKGAGGQLDLPL